MLHPRVVPLWHEQAERGRLPEALVDQIDARVQEGVLTSPAAVVTSAFEHEFRRRRAERDAEIYAATESQDDPTT